MSSQREESGLHLTLVTKEVEQIKLPANLISTLVQNHTKLTSSAGKNFSYEGLQVQKN
jgi:hypothetical protein